MEIVVRDLNCCSINCMNCSTFKLSEIGRIWFKLIYQLVVSKKSGDGNFRNLMKYVEELESRGAYWASVEIESINTIIKCVDCKSQKCRE